MTEQPLAPVAVDAYSSVANGDIARLRALLAPDVVLRDPGHHGNAGQHRGADAVLAFLGRAQAATHLDVLEVMGGHDHAAVYCRGTGERADGRRLDNHTVHLLSIVDGRITGLWFHNRDQAHVDEFWR